MAVILSHISFGVGEFFSTTFLMLFILSLCLYLYMLSKNETYKRSKYAIASLSIILILHLIVFPFVYTLMLKNNPACFEFKTAIYSNRKQVLLNEWIDDSRSIPGKIKELESIKVSSNIVLDKNLKELKRLTFTNDYIIHTDIKLEIPGRNLTATVYIFNKDGFLKNILFKSGSQSELDSTKFGSVLKSDISYLKNQLEYYRIKKTELDRNNVWTFATLLPYSVSSLFTGNMVPITPAANIFYTMHYLLIYSIGIGIFLHFLIININSLIRNSRL